MDYDLFDLHVHDAGWVLPDGDGSCSVEEQIEHTDALNTHYMHHCAGLLIFEQLPRYCRRGRPLRHSIAAA